MLKTRALTGTAAIITAVMLVGASGLELVLGWALWAAGLVVLMSASPGAAAGAERRSERKRAAKRYSLVP